MSILTYKEVEMSKGTVKFFDEVKGFGFIVREDGGDLFFHVTNAQGNQYQKDDPVDFDIGENDKGPCAVNVRPSEARH